MPAYTASAPNASNITSPSSEPVASESSAESVTPLPADKSATSSTDEEPPPPPKKAQITDVGQIYESINTTECLTWPATKIKKKGGKNGWGKFYPKKGDTGVIVKEMQHCHLEDNVYIIELEQYYVPISSVGVKIMNGKSASAEEK